MNSERSSGQHTSQVGWRNMSSRMPWSNVCTWRQSVARKMGHFGRSGARHSRQRRGTTTIANCRRRKRLVTSGHRGFAGESKSRREELTTDRSKYVGNHWLRLCTREKVLLWCSGHSDGVRSAGRKWKVRKQSEITLARAQATCGVVKRNGLWHVTFLKGSLHYGSRQCVCLRSYRE